MAAGAQDEIKKVLTSVDKTKENTQPADLTREDLALLKDKVIKERTGSVDFYKMNASDLYDRIKSERGGDIPLEVEIALRKRIEQELLETETAVDGTLKGDEVATRPKTTPGIILSGQSGSSSRGRGSTTVSNDARPKDYFKKENIKKGDKLRLKETKNIDKTAIFDYAGVYIRVTKLKNGLFFVYIGESGGSLSTAGKRLGDESSQLIRDAVNGPKPDGTFRFTSNAYAAGIHSFGESYLFKKKDEERIEVVIPIQLYDPTISKFNVNIQEAVVIDKVIRDMPIKFTVDGNTVNLRLREALYELEQNLDPSWFPEGSTYVVCNTKNLPRNCPKQLSLNLARELVNARPQEISRLTKEKILRIFRGQARTLQELLA